MKRYFAPLSAVFTLLVLGAVVLGIFVMNGPQSAPGTVNTLGLAGQTQASGPLNGGFVGAVALEASHQGVFSDTVQTTPQEMGEIDLGLLLTQVSSTVTGYVDLANTLVVTGEHTIQATPIAPTPLSGTPALQPVALAVGPSISGSFDGTTLLLMSERTVGMAAGRAIARQFQMTGTLESGATFLALRGIYRETLWDYSPQPLTVVGHFELIQPIFASAQVETPTPTPSTTPTPTSTPVAPPSATPTPTSTPVVPPSATPTPTSTPTATPTATPTTQSGGATVTGTVYDDQNGNGQQDGGEPGMAGAEVTLTSALRDVDLTRMAITNVGGIYAFADVPVGHYSVQVKLPVGQSGATPPPVTVNVTGAGTVTAPPVAVQVMKALYLPSINR